MLNFPTMTNVDRILAEAKKLSDEEFVELRARLPEAEARGEMAPDIKAAWDEEVQRRKRQLEAGETATRPWDEVKADFLKLGK